jgi:two-component system, OmpR family, response regulator
VDDNRDAADTLCVLLRMSGYDCRAAYDGEAGFQVACDFRPDCMLLDLAMPGMDGFTLARKLRTQPDLERARLFAMTAYSDWASRKRALEAGFDDYFVKPMELVEVERLKEKLNAVVRLAAQTEELARANIHLMEESKELIKEIKNDAAEIKHDLSEIKGDLRDLKEEIRKAEDATTEERPAERDSSA